MHKAFSELTRNVELAAERLRADYDIEQLHDLRVAIRRIRSLLKQRGKRRARRWRRIWGSFAGVTNRARDWDVFLESAGARLPAAGVAQLQAICQGRVDAARAAVRAMLDSAAWRRYLEEWKDYALPRSGRHRRAGGRAAARKAPPRDTLKPALAHANRALAAALALPDDSGWHPFRIAIKELRYVAERLPAGDGPAGPLTVTEICKRLQTPLGDWHDCIVQLQLVGQLEGAAPAGDAVLRELRAAIETLRRHNLTEVHAVLAQQPLLSVPKAAQP
jgi:CHAD domain-containing protein